MKDTFSHRKRKDVVSRPRRRDDEEIVQNGLSVTPAQMLEMAEHNIPISPANLGAVYDEGYTDLDYNVPAQYQRGIDIGDLWELKESTREKFKAGYKKMPKNYEEVVPNTLN